ncbi:hypothetical protein OJAV_G00234870 [Oryzias javanicus]|uniref:AIG1-type G domain-containing protein n=1 Tax=Oryzias javanicus TaxID=123683 RepID=A0A3S2P2M1_ORYJA|nr:hypothetical protein OJAV_G00234870 [Oryzias javanicus]
MEEGTPMKNFTEMRIVVVGKTGSGKSSLAHTIFGEEQSPNKSVFNSETTKCEAKTKDVDGKCITLIDCPGFFDTNMSEDEKKPEIMRCITECAPGPHAFLIVLKIERFTEQEQSVITKLCEYFSDEALKHAVVVFTYGDQLPEGTKIDEFVHENKLLSDLVKKCGNRCHVVDNRYWRKGSVDEYRSNQFQVKELLHTVETMMKTNENSFFTNEMLQKVDEEIREEEAKIRQEAGNKSEKEIKQKAKDEVLKKLMIRCAGIAVGVLLGALFGVFCPVGLAIIFRAGLGVLGGEIVGCLAAIGAATVQQAAKKVTEAAKGAAKATLKKVTSIKKDL